MGNKEKSQGCKIQAVVRTKWHKDRSCQGQHHPHQPTKGGNVELRQK